MVILISLGAALFFSAANLLDSYFSNKIFGRVSTIVFFSAFFNLLTIPIVMVIGQPAFPPLPMLALFALIGLIDVLYLFPYYRALQVEDASIVSALFALGRIYAPFLAYFVVGELVTFWQYLGFIVLVLASVFLTLDKGKVTFRLRKSFWLVLASALIIYSESSIYKYTFIQNVHWSTAVFWAAVFSALFMFLTILIPKQRQQIKDALPAFRKIFWLFSAEELLTVLGMLCMVYAVSIAPITIVNGIGSVQPFIILGLAFLSRKFLPGTAFRESAGRQDILKKVLLFAVMLIGMLLLRPVG